MSEFPSEELEYSGLYYESDSSGQYGQHGILVMKYNSNNIIYDDIVTLTPYEVDAIISARARQIQDGAHPAVDIKSTDPIKTAMMELKEHKIPLILMRRYPNGVVDEIPLFETDYILPRNIC
jgi:DNA-directed RNA polymerase subunit K/omega